MLVPAAIIALTFVSRSDGGEPMRDIRQHKTEAECAAILARKLSKATGENVTAQNMLGWFEGERGYVKVDRIVRRYLGPGRYDCGENTARMIPMLEAVLDGKHTAKIGGMQFIRLQEREF
jgi:hypothetical protein